MHHLGVILATWQNPLMSIKVFKFVLAVLSPSPSINTTSFKTTRKELQCPSIMYVLWGRSFSSVVQRHLLVYYPKLSCILKHCESLSFLSPTPTFLPLYLLRFLLIIFHLHHINIISYNVPEPRRRWWHCRRRLTNSTPDYVSSVTSFCSRNEWSPASNWP